MRPPDLDYHHIVLPHKEIGIGVIGSGGIVRNAHLPAYSQAGFSVMGISGRNGKTVEELGAQFHIPQRSTDYRQLLDNSEIHVIDIAIPGEARIDIVRDVAAAGKHMLIQKPLANTLAEAREIVLLAKQHGVLLAVNQNARYAPAYRAAWSILKQSLIGEVFDITHDMRDNQDSQSWWQSGWQAREEKFQIAQYAVHHLDLIRFWMGREPEWVLSHTSRKPGQAARGEMMADIILHFDAMAQAVLIERNACWHEAEPKHTFRIEGTEGLIEGDALNNSISVQSHLWPGETWQPELKGHWFPDAFAATMGELLDAIATSATPSLNGEDNLHTMALVEAAYVSANRHRAVALTEIW